MVTQTVRSRDLRDDPEFDAKKEILKRLDQKERIRTGVRHALFPTETVGLEPGPKPARAISQSTAGMNFENEHAHAPTLQPVRPDNGENSVVHGDAARPYETDHSAKDFFAKTMELEKILMERSMEKNMVCGLQMLGVFRGLMMVPTSRDYTACKYVCVEVSFI